MRLILLSVLLTLPMLPPVASARTPYVLALMPDVQTACRAGGLDWPQKMVQYIVDQKAAYVANPATGRNIIGIVGLGDKTNKIAQVGNCHDALIDDWLAAYTDIALAASMPVVPTLGNHGLNPTNAITVVSADLYRTHFGGTFLTSQSTFNKCAGTAEGTRYGLETNCSFSLPTGNGTDKLHVITTEYHSSDGQTDPNSDTLTKARDWVIATAHEHSDEPLVVITHDNLKTNATMQDHPQACGKSGVVDYWSSDTALESIPWFFGMFNGHDVNPQAAYTDGADPDLFNWSCFVEETNPLGFKVLYEMRNYQKLDTQSMPQNGSGDGLIWFMTINEDAGCIESISCSPDTIGDYCRNSFRETYTICGFDFSVRRRPSVPSLSPVPVAVLCLLLGGSALLLLVSRRSRA